MGGTIAPARRRIAVVDDDEALRRGIHLVLQDAGYDVTSFGSGREAFSGLHDGPAPDLILLDLSMPEMNGWEFRARQMRDTALRDTPVVVMSTGSEPDADAIEATLVLAKPFSNEALVHSIERIFSAAAMGRAPLRDGTAEARLMALGTLAASIAHEINDPLACLTLNLEALRRALAPGVNGETASLLCDAIDAASHIRGVVREVSAFARAEAVECPAVRVERILDSSLRLVAHQIRPRAELVKDYGETPRVSAPDGRLSQLFINLLVNAAQAIPRGSPHDNTVRVSTRRSALGECVIEVADSGSGIAPDLISRVFDPYFTTKPPGEGTGLGLSISNAIVASLGGRIEVESSLGRGSTFRVVLPAATHPESQRTLASERTTSRRVLVVDDDAMLCRTLVHGLSPHRVTVATSCAQALELVSTDGGFDLIVCDVSLLPAGMDLRAELAAHEPGLADELVLVTPGPVMGSPHRLGAVTLEKPFDVADLRAMLETRRGL